MNAAELYEIVKDLPFDAWPELAWHKEQWRCCNPEHCTWDDQVSVDLAEAAFVGSMVAWLIGEGHHVHEWDSNSDTSTATLVLYDREFSVSTDKYRGMGTIVALLAAACKEARP